MRIYKFILSLAPPYVKHFLLIFLVFKRFLVTFPAACTAVLLVGPGKPSPLQKAPPEYVRGSFAIASHDLLYKV